LELKALLSLVAVFISAVIPLLNTPLVIQGTSVAVRTGDLAVLALVIIGGAAAGWGTHRLQHFLRSRRGYR
jgi:hypothetical protein